MRAGMTLAERNELRTQLTEQAVEEARKNALRPYLSSACAFEQSQAEHDRCLGETAGNGCLCPGHDPGPEPG